MPTTSISPNPGLLQPGAAQGSSRAVRQDFQNLATAPASGDLAGVKDAFNAIQQLLQESGPAKASPSQGGDKPKNPFGTDVLAFGKALLSGGLESAQDAVSSLLGDIQAARSRSRTSVPDRQSVSVASAIPVRASAAGPGRPIGSLINVRA